MRLVKFRLRGKLGHYLRAETSASALSYPVPPRTAILGVVGAILGLAKDEPPVLLEPASIALSGRLPATCWHKIKLRKDPPRPLPFSVKAGIKGSSKDEKPTLILQEWLWKPDYIIRAALPEEYQQAFLKRLQERRWHFSPCLGLSEMGADLEFLDEVECERLASGCYEVTGVVPTGGGRLHDDAFNRGLSLRVEQLPRTCTGDRLFTRATYYMEKNAEPIPFETDEAWRAGEEVFLFL